MWQQCCRPRRCVWVKCCLLPSQWKSLTFWHHTPHQVQTPPHTFFTSTLNNTFLQQTLMRCSFWISSCFLVARSGAVSLGMSGLWGEGGEKGSSSSLATSCTCHLHSIPPSIGEAASINWRAYCWSLLPHSGHQLMPFVPKHKFYYRIILGLLSACLFSQPLADSLLITRARGSRCTEVFLILCVCLLSWLCPILASGTV